MSLKKIAGLAAAGALAASIGLAAPASAQNYAPGLPPAEQGIPNNPPTSAPIVPTVTLVDEQSAVAAQPPRLMLNPPGDRIGAAPVVFAQRGAPIPLVAIDLEPGARYWVFIKRPGEDYGTLGTVIGSSWSALPVFSVSRDSRVVVALKNVATGATKYIKIDVTS